MKREIRSCFWWPGRDSRSVWWAIYWILRSTLAAFRALIWKGRFDNLEIELRNLKGDNGRCWCYVGSSTTLRFTFSGDGCIGGWGGWIKITRDPRDIAEPCVCDVALHEAIHVPNGEHDCCAVWWRDYEKHAAGCRECQASTEICDAYLKRRTA